MSEWEEQIKMFRRGGGGERERERERERKRERERRMGEDQRVDEKPNDRSAKN